MSHSKNTMRANLMLAKKACNPESPSPTAELMKFSNGNLIAYGGTFCVQIPCGIDADCAFKPSAMLSFFRKDRSQVTYTVNKGRLKVRHSRESVTIHCLEASEMPIIDVFKKAAKVSKFLSKKALKSMIECIDPAEPRQVLQGLCLRDGLAMATDGRILSAMVSGLPKNVLCVVPIDTVKFMASLDEEVNGVTYDDHLVKFTYPSGMTICSRTLDATEFPEIKTIMKVKGEKVTLHPDTLAEIKGLTCDDVLVCQKGVLYRSEDGKFEGAINLKVDGEFDFSISRKRFELLLSLTIDNTIYIDNTMKAIHANGKKFFRMVLMQKQSRVRR